MKWKPCPDINSKTCAAFVLTDMGPVSGDSYLDEEAGHPSFTSFSLVFVSQAIAGPERSSWMK